MQTIKYFQIMRSLSLSSLCLICFYNYNNRSPKGSLVADQIQVWFVGLLLFAHSLNMVSAPIFFTLFYNITAEPSQNGSVPRNSQNGGPNTSHSMSNQTMSMVPISAVGPVSGVPGPTTNLNIGMDYWGTAASSAMPAMQGKVPAAPVAAGMVTTGSRDSIQSQLWVQVSFFLFSSLVNIFFWLKIDV